MENSPSPDHATAPATAGLGPVVPAAGEVAPLIGMAVAPPPVEAAPGGFAATSETPLATTAETDREGGVARVGAAIGGLFHRAGDFVRRGYIRVTTPATPRAAHTAPAGHPAATALAGTPPAGRSGIRRMFERTSVQTAATAGVFFLGLSAVKLFLAHHGAELPSTGGSGTTHAQHVAEAVQPMQNQAPAAPAVNPAELKMSIGDLHASKEASDLKAGLWGAVGVVAVTAAGYMVPLVRSRRRNSEIRLDNWRERTGAYYAELAALRTTQVTHDANRDGRLPDGTRKQVPYMTDADIPDWWRGRARTPLGDLKRYDPNNNPRIATLERMGPPRRPTIRERYFTKRIPTESAHHERHRRRHARRGGRGHHP